MAQGTSNGSTWKSPTDPGAEDGLSDDIGESIGAIMLPDPDLGNLHEIENQMRAANSNPGGRGALAKFVLSNAYIPKLIPLVEDAEDLESASDLHRLCSIMKMLILLNDTAIIEYVVTDEVVLGVVGALEYDPDFPLHKANHRQYLSDESKFKEVVKIEEQAIKRKIHYTYRLQYLKDVVLARILDDPTKSILFSICRRMDRFSKNSLASSARQDRVSKGKETQCCSSSSAPQLRKVYRPRTGHSYT
jgi:protein phosphatase-4 regulatory subunit 3